MTAEPLAVNPFWDFSLALYASEPVAQQCLALQDDWDADVNLVLYGIWLAHHGVIWTDQIVKKLQEEFDPWRKIAIIPLRTVRRRLRFQARRRYYNFLKDCELRAERHQQDCLWLQWQAEHSSAVLPIAPALFQELLRVNLLMYVRRLEMRPRAQSMHPQVDEQIENLITVVVLQRNALSLPD